jgi:hypothetical protein
MPPVKQKEYKKPELPKPREFFPDMGPRWIKMEPARLAMLGGLFFSTLLMLIYFVRQLMGATMAPMEMILGIAKTFLVSYAGTGFFVWYLLRIAERELSHLVEVPKEVDEDENADTEFEREAAEAPPQEPEEFS